MMVYQLTLFPLYPISSFIILRGYYVKTIKEEYTTGYFPLTLYCSDGSSRRFLSVHMYNFVTIKCAYRWNIAQRDSYGSFERFYARVHLSNPKTVNGLIKLLERKTGA